MTDQLNTTEERCSCGGTIIFDDERGVARCPNCKSYEAYTTPALREKAKATSQPQTTPPKPDSYEKLAEKIAHSICGPDTRGYKEATIARLLVDFADEICRRAIEP